MNVRITFDVGCCDARSVPSTPRASSITSYHRSRRPSTPPPLPPLPSLATIVSSSSPATRAAATANGRSALRRRHSGDVHLRDSSTHHRSRACNTLPITLAPADDTRPSCNGSASFHYDDMFRKYLESSETAHSYFKLKYLGRAANKTNTGVLMVVCRCESCIAENCEEIVA